jgi:cell wall-associated NlpC family hydrolase
MVRALGLVTGVAIFVASVSAARRAARVPGRFHAGEPPRRVPSAGGAIERGVLATALELRGAPIATAAPTRPGFDCSGFTQYVFAAHGVALPVKPANSSKEAIPCRAGGCNPRPHLLYNHGAGASHVGIVVDADAFVHAPSSRAWYGSSASHAVLGNAAGWRAPGDALRRSEVRTECYAARTWRFGTTRRDVSRRNWRRWRSSSA